MKKIYILHGWAYSTEKWEPFVKELKRNKIEAEMLMIPGLTAALDKVWNIDDYTEWLNKIISKEKEPVTLLGHSNGGRIALSFVSKYPEKVKKLILIDSAGIYHNELPIRFKRLIFGAIAKIGKGLTGSERMRKLLYRFAREHDYEKADPIAKKTMVNLIKTDIAQELKKINIKTQIIWGREDRITPLSDGKFINMKIKDSVLNIIENAKHSPMFTHPKEVTDVIFKNL